MCCVLSVEHVFFPCIQVSHLPAGQAPFRCTCWTLMTTHLTCSPLRWKCARGRIPTPSTSQPVTLTWHPTLDPSPSSWPAVQQTCAVTGRWVASMVSMGSCVWASVFVLIFIHSLSVPTKENPKIKSSYIYSHSMLVEDSSNKVQR